MKSDVRPLVRWIALAILLTASHSAFAFYNPSAGRWISRDPIGEESLLNMETALTWPSGRTEAASMANLAQQRLAPPYLFVRNTPAGSFDFLGLLVDAVLDTSANTLTVTDRDTGKSITVIAFTGGRADKDCKVAVGAPGSGEIPVPKGSYTIGTDPKSKPGWFGVFANDRRFDDYFDDKGTERNGIRLHLGTWSQGCVTVCLNQADAKKRYEELSSIITNTKTEQVDFIAGPHWWNPFIKITKYGTITVK